MQFSDQVNLIKKSRQLHAAWYRETYPDVAELGMDPAEHYLHFGAAMGRNPGKNFDTRFYVDTYPEVVESGLNPLVHFAVHGKDRGYDCRPPTNRARNQVNVIRTKLLSLGFTEKPLQELNALLNTNSDPDVRALSARELALWHMREKTEAGYRLALEYLAKARVEAADLDFRSKLTTAELLCHYHLGEMDAGKACYDRAALAGEVTPDVTLAWVNYQPTADSRIAVINTMLARYGIEPVTLLPDDGTPPYDRLTCAHDLPKIADGPKVTVLIAAYDAAEMLPTALRSLQEQTWQNLEIIVLDDCSPTLDTVEVARRFAATDPRIRVIRMEENGGAYVARNRGLDAATGEFVTLHDADDWSHPRKIESQVKFLRNNARAVGCMSEQARQRSDLSFQRWTGQGSIIINNASSFLWRKAPVREKLGYWDTVRFSADSELIRRVRRVFGSGSVAELPSGPLSFQRDSETSVVADEVMGMNGFYFGARKEYHDAQRHFHDTGSNLKYFGGRDARPFPVPSLMTPDRNRLEEEGVTVDLVFCGDFRPPVYGLERLMASIAELRDCGKSVGVIEAYEYGKADEAKSMCSKLRSFLHQKDIEIFVYGNKIRTQKFVKWSLEKIEPNRYFPSIDVLENKVCYL